MPIALLSGFAISLRILVLTVMMVAPLAAVGFAGNGGLGIGKQGAGLVLFVTLQRQSMI